MKKKYDVWYEIVNHKTKKTEKRIIQTGLDYKTALAVKRSHKKICAMHLAQAGTIAAIQQTVTGELLKAQ